MAYAAIRTTFLKATNTRGERIKATLEGDLHGSVTLPYDYALNAFSSHRRAAQALADRFFNTYVTWYKIAKEEHSELRRETRTI